MGRRFLFILNEEKSVFIQTLVFAVLSEVSTCLNHLKQVFTCFYGNLVHHRACSTDQMIRPFPYKMFSSSTWSCLFQHPSGQLHEKHWETNKEPLLAVSPVYGYHNYDKGRCTSTFISLIFIISQLQSLKCLLSIKNARPFPQSWDVRINGAARSSQTSSSVWQTQLLLLQRLPDVRDATESLFRLPPAELHG